MFPFTMSTGQSLLWLTSRTLTQRTASPATILSPEKNQEERL
jgi:hypothetical protein